MTWTGYSSDFGDGKSFPVTLPGNTVGTGVVVGTNLYSVCISPDGTTGYFAEITNHTVYKVTLSTLAVAATWTIPSGSIRGLAVTPDGSTLLVSTSDNGHVYKVTTSSGTGSVGTDLGAVGGAGIAITPDGLTAYCADNFVRNIKAVTISSGAVTATIDCGAGTAPYSIALTPDGSTLFAALSGSDQLARITGLGGTPTVTKYSSGAGSAPQAVMVNSAGTYCLMTCGNASTVRIFDIVAGTLGSAITGFNNPAFGGIDPTGSVAYVPNAGSGGTTVVPVTLATGSVGTAMTVGTRPFGFTITPDQAPTAAFTLGTPTGLTVGIATDTSSSPTGTVVKWHVDWGDGNSDDYLTHAAFLAATHTYSTGGTYTVALTVTNSAGTSTSQVFTGQTVSLNGGPSATVSHGVTVSSGLTGAAALTATGTLLADTGGEAHLTGVSTLTADATAKGAAALAGSGSLLVVGVDVALPTPPTPGALVSTVIDAYTCDDHGQISGLNRSGQVVAQHTLTSPGVPVGIAALDGVIYVLSATSASFPNVSGAYTLHTVKADLSAELGSVTALASFGSLRGPANLMQAGVPGGGKLYVANHAVTPPVVLQMSTAGVLLNTFTLSGSPVSHPAASVAPNGVKSSGVGVLSVVTATGERVASEPVNTGTVAVETWAAGSPTDGEVTGVWVAGGSDYTLSDDDAALVRVHQKDGTLAVSYPKPTALVGHTVYRGHAPGEAGDRLYAVAFPGVVVTFDAQNGTAVTWAKPGDGTQIRLVCPARTAATSKVPQFLSRPPDAPGNTVKPNGQPCQAWTGEPMPDGSPNVITFPLANRLDLAGDYLADGARNDPIVDDTNGVGTADVTAHPGLWRLGFIDWDGWITEIGQVPGPRLPDWDGYPLDAFSGEPERAGPDTYRINWVRVRARLKADAGGDQALRVYLWRLNSLGLAWPGYFRVDEQLGPYQVLTVPKDGTFYDAYGPTMALDPSTGFDWDPAPKAYPDRGEPAVLAGASDINSLAVGLQFTGGLIKGMYASELRLELEYTRRHTTVVTGPVGNVNTTRPTVAWEVDAPDSPSPQEGVIVRIYDEATYSQPGFDPWDPPAWRPVYVGGAHVPPGSDLTSLDMWSNAPFAFDASSRSRKVQPGYWDQFFAAPQLEVGGTYRAYVWVSQPWSGNDPNKRWWNALSYSTFTVVPVHGPSPTVELFPDADGIMVAVKVTAPSTSDSDWTAMMASLDPDPTTAWYEIQHQLSDGSWEPVRMYDGERLSANLLAGSGHDAFMDYEPSTGAGAQYRVRAVWENPDGDQAASDWVYASCDLLCDHWVLRAPWHPTTWAPAHLGGEDWTYESDSRTTVKTPIGREMPVVIGGGIVREMFTLNVAFAEDSDYQTFEVVRRVQDTLVLIGPRNQRFYMRLTDKRSTKQTVDDGTGGIWRQVDIAAAEQGKPDLGTVQALPGDERDLVEADAVRLAGP